jgi:hypothetical protein
MLREQFAHAHEAQIGKIWLSICVTVGKPSELRKMFPAVKRQCHETFIYHRENYCGALQMKCSFREDRLTCQQRLSDAGGDLSRPRMVFVVGVCERDQESSICDALHGRENPFRAERSRAPRTLPASLMNDGSAPLSRAFSSCSRMMRPRGMPERFEAWSSHAASSFVRRIVTV